MRLLACASFPLLLLASPALVEASPEAATHFTFSGRSTVDVERLWKKTKEKQRVTLKLVQVSPGRWQVTYEDAKHVCRLEGTGPMKAIALVPDQTCHSSINEDEVRGKASATVLSGHISVGPGGSGRFGITAQLEGTVQTLISTKSFGVTLKTWSPSFSASGMASYEGRIVEP